MEIKKVGDLHHRGKNTNLGTSADINGKHFKTGFSQAEKGKELYKKVDKELNDFTNSNDVNLVIGNTFLSTSNILQIEPSELDFSKKSYHLLEEGNDGILLSGLNDLYSDERFIKNNLGIIIGVRDCTPIMGSLKNGEHLFNLHGAYRGVLGNGNNPGILYNFFETLKRINIGINEIDDLIIGPMALKNFELPLDFVKKYSKEFDLEYGKKIKFENYFKPNGKINENGQILGYLDIEKIILEVLKYHGVDKNKIHNMRIDTGDLSNN